MSTSGKNNKNQSLKKHWSLAEAKEKLESYCAYQERCHWEVRKKLSEKEFMGMRPKEFISELVTDGFLNEERYARAYVRGKFRMKHWGKVRIALELKSRNISPRCIQYGLSEIDPEEYYDSLLLQAKKKWGKTKEPDLRKKLHKVIRYLIGRGYEQDLVQEVVPALSDMM